MTPVDGTIRERDATHGDYCRQSELTQAIKGAMHEFPEFGALPPHVREALEMIAVKMSRIVTGNHTLADHWHDIQGYARLVESRLPK